MKIQNVLMVAMCCGLLSACENRDRDRTTDRDGNGVMDELQNDARRGVESAEDAVEQRREEYMNTIDAKLDRLDKQIDDLEDRIDEASASEKSALEKKLDRLELKRDAVETRYDEFKASGSEAWEDLKDGVDQAINDLEDEIDELHD